MTELAEDADRRRYEKPLPSPTPLAQPFWDAVRRHELQLQRCVKCGHYNHPPKIMCSKCHGRELEWQTVPASGTVYSYTIVHRPPFPVFKADVPYGLALVDIDDTDVRLLSNVVCPTEDIHIGMRVEVMFDDVTDDFTLFRFRPVREARRGEKDQ